MEVITIESKAYNELVEKIEKIERYITEKSQRPENLEEMYVDGYEVCRHLRISMRTLQRLRTKRVISYSMIGGKSYYTIAELKRVLEAKLIRRNDECLNNLIAYYQSSVLKSKDSKK